MDNNNEITVNILDNLNMTIKKLKSQGFLITKDFIMNDIYYVKNNTNLYSPSIEILKNSLIIRTINNKTSIVYKDKKYDENENIISQSKISLDVSSIDEAKIFLKTIGYNNLMNIKSHIIILEKESFALALQEVNDKYLLLEAEENKIYNNINKLIKKLQTININYDKNNYFVKKTKIILENDVLRTIK